MITKESLFTPRFIAEGAMIAAIYVVLTLVFAPISYGPVQVRVAEALTILPLFTPAAIPGLFVGCVLANILGGGIIWDIIFGSLATLIGAVIGYRLRHNQWLVPIPAIVSNTAIVPFVLRYGYGVKDMPFMLLVLSIAVGEIAGCFILGEILASALRPHRKVLFGNV